jgi:glycosyltransferase involved in cell wall biosynthesis
MNSNSEKPMLSIITVCRNEVSRIQTTINSIIHQSNRNFEWIVVDGASSDGTLDLLHARKPPHTKLITEPDKGIYDAMNKGVRLAHGTYLLFLNAGDWLADDHVLEDFHRQSPREDLVIGDILIKYPDGREQYRPSAACGTNQDYLYWRSLPHQSTFIRRSLFDLCGDFDTSFRIGADWEFFARTILHHNASIMKWSRCVTVFPNDGFSADPANVNIRNRDRRRIRQTHFPLSYRVRRYFNENWGRLVTWLRNHAIPSSR